MKYRRLGNTGLKLSEIGLGGWLTFGSQVDRDRGRAIMDRALELGITFLDTANGYAGGECETLWGEYLEPRNRAAFVLATKVYFPTGEAPTERGLSRKAIREQCEASLRRLRTDHIDLYQCHRYDPETPLEETVRMMDDLIRQGKVLYWGVSEWTGEQIRAAVAIARAGGYAPPVSNQPCYNMLERRIEGDVLAACRENGLGIVPFSPLAQGILTGKYKPDEPLPKDSRGADDQHNIFMTEPLRDKAMLERVQQMAALAGEAGVTPAQLALRWLLRHDEITSCICGASRPEHVEWNASAADVEIDPAVLARAGALLA